MKNSDNAAKLITLEGTGLPETFTLFLTTSRAENFKEMGTVKTGAGNKFELPANSIITLQAGGDPL